MTQRSEYPSPYEQSARPEWLLDPGIGVIVVPGKGVDLVPHPSGEFHQVVPTESSNFAAVASGLIYAANVHRPEFMGNPLVVIYSGSFNVNPANDLSKVQKIDARITEALAMALKAQKIGNIPTAAIWLDNKAEITEDNAKNASDLIRDAGLVGGVAMITDRPQRPVFRRRLRAHGIKVAQEILFENVLRHVPGYEEPIARWEANNRSREALIRGVEYQVAYQIPPARWLMRRQARKTRSGGNAFPVLNHPPTLLNQ